MLFEPNRTLNPEFGKLTRRHNLTKNLTRVAAFIFYCIKHLYSSVYKIHTKVIKNKCLYESAVQITVYHNRLYIVILINFNSTPIVSDIIWLGTKKIKNEKKKNVIDEFAFSKNYIIIHYWNIWGSVEISILRQKEISCAFFYRVKRNFNH